MDVTPQISVIVPIYNVEKYVRKCLDSLLLQTMKQIEVICIDDGSTDGSGTIADEYTSEDWPIFRVIHTENRGLSVARNLGIDESKADWLMFVDSDDWVSEEFCRIPYKAALENQADLIAFQSYEVTENGRIKKEVGRTIQVGLIDSEKAVDLNGPAVWRKLYKKDLFQTIRFPEGVVFEDLAITHKLLYSANRIYSISDRLYFHRFRVESISHLLSLDSDRLILSKQRYKEITKLGYPENKAKAQLIGEALRCCGRAESIDSRLYKEAELILKEAKGIPSNLSNKELIIFYIWRLNKLLYRALYKKTLRY